MKGPGDCEFCSDNKEASRFDKPLSFPALFDHGISRKNIGWEDVRCMQWWGTTSQWTAAEGPHHVNTPINALLQYTLLLENNCFIMPPVRFCILSFERWMAVFGKNYLQYFKLTWNMAKWSGLDEVSSESLFYLLRSWKTTFLLFVNKCSVSWISLDKDKKVLGDINQKFDAMATNYLTQHIYSKHCHQIIISSCPSLSFLLVKWRFVRKYISIDYWQKEAFINGATSSLHTELLFRLDQI